MTTPPSNPKIYHITHVQNLTSIVESGSLWSDAKRIDKSLDCEIVGMSNIKQRRLRLPVRCHAGTTVGKYVPFYFCPRSIMLYILYMGNHPELTYRAGQEPIVHLEADLCEVVEWADANDVPWAFSDRNAGAYLARFYNDLGDLDEINWASVRATDFRDAQVREGKQAEFLVHESFPWTLFERIGVSNQNISQEVRSAMVGATHRPVVSVEQGWYY